MLGISIFGFCVFGAIAPFIAWLWARKSVTMVVIIYMSLFISVIVLLGVYVAHHNMVIVPKEDLFWIDGAGFLAGCGILFSILAGCFEKLRPRNHESA